MATAAGEPSVAQLRRQAERSRTELTGTVEELRTQVADTATHLKEAVAPATIKRQVSEYVRQSSENMMQTIQRRARENPLQAVAIGAGLAYPVFNLMRAIPAPLLLIGAGLALSRSTAVQQATNQAFEQVRDNVAEATDAARSRFHDARDAAGSALERASDAITSAKDRIADTLSSASGKAGDAAGEAFDSGQDSLSQLGSGAADIVSRTKDMVTDTYNQSPLLIAGLGLVVGALIASSLPTTSTENRMFGDSAERLRRRASEAATEGLEAAKDAASDLVEAAGQQGLSPQGLSSAAGQMTQKVRSVAERAVETALGDAPTQPRAGASSQASGGATNQPKI
jgi:ElaB/YqjD/DUF883 family membrane-anchored ribosome-binding protein